jgi:hypothetical protein
MFFRIASGINYKSFPRKVEKKTGAKKKENDRIKSYVSESSLCLNEAIKDLIEDTKKKLIVKFCSGFQMSLSSGIGLKRSNC